MIREERFRKAEGETFHQKGQKIWLIEKKWVVSVKPQGKKSLGVVLKDSVWPDMFVTVEIWNKAEWLKFYNFKNPEIALEVARKANKKVSRPKQRKGDLVGEQAKTLEEAKAWVMKTYGYEKPKRKRSRMNPLTRGMVWVKSKGICHYCEIQTVYEGPKNGEKPKPNQFTVDHKLPVSLGGNDSPGNLVGSCQDCNVKKADLTEAQFKKKFAEYLKLKGKFNASKANKA